MNKNVDSCNNCCCCIASNSYISRIPATRGASITHGYWQSFITSTRLSGKSPAAFVSAASCGSSVQTSVISNLSNGGCCFRHPQTPGQNSYLATSLGVLLGYQ